MATRKELDHLYHTLGLPPREQRRLPIRESETEIARKLANGWEDILLGLVRCPTLLQALLSRLEEQHWRPNTHGLYPLQQLHKKMLDASLHQDNDRLTKLHAEVQKQLQALHVPLPMLQQLHRLMELALKEIRFCRERMRMVLVERCQLPVDCIDTELRGEQLNTGWLASLIERHPLQQMALQAHGDDVRALQYQLLALQQALCMPLREVDELGYYLETLYRDMVFGAQMLLLTHWRKAMNLVKHSGKSSRHPDTLASICEAGHTLLERAALSYVQPFGQRFPDHMKRVHQAMEQSPPSLRGLEDCPYPASTMSALSAMTRLYQRHMCEHGCPPSTPDYLRVLRVPLDRQAQVLALHRQHRENAHHLQLQVLLYGSVQRSSKLRDWLQG